VKYYFSFNRSENLNTNSIVLAWETLCT